MGPSTENGFQFKGKSQFVTSQNFPYVTAKSKLSQLFSFFACYVTSAVLLSQIPSMFDSDNDGFRNFSKDPCQSESGGGGG